MKYYGIILLITALSAGCFQESENGNNRSDNNQYQQLTSATRIMNVDLSKIFDNYDNPSELIHTASGEEIFVSTPIEAPIIFNSIYFGYEFSEPQYREDHAERVKFFVRFSEDGVIWTDWTRNVPIVGEGRGSPEVRAIRSTWPFGKMVRFMQIKIVSAPENEGKIILKNLTIAYDRYIPPKKIENN